MYIQHNVPHISPLPTHPHPPTLTQNNTPGVVVTNNTSTFNALLNGTANSTGTPVPTQPSNGTVARNLDTVAVCTDNTLGCATCDGNGCVTCPVGFMRTVVCEIWGRVCLGDWCVGGVLYVVCACVHVNSACVAHTRMHSAMFTNHRVLPGPLLIVCSVAGTPPAPSAPSVLLVTTLVVRVPSTMCWYV